MVDLSEIPYAVTFNKPTKPSNTIVVDNGLYEIKAGYLSDPCIVALNRIFRYKERVSMESFPQSTMKSMFEDDIIANFDTLETTIDIILTHLQPSNISNLLFTAAPNLPTEPDLIDFLFKTYKFDKIQIGTDYLYAYHHYFKDENAVIIAVKHSSIVVSYISDCKEIEIFKSNFGIKKLTEYINMVMTDRYRNYRMDYSRLIEHIRVSKDYNRESVEIYNEICKGNNKRNLIIKNRVKETEQESIKKTKKQPSTIQIPEIDYELLELDDKELEPERLKEKRKNKSVLVTTMGRLRIRIETQLKELASRVEMIEDELERRRNPKQHLELKKGRFYELIRKLELRAKLRQDAHDRKTREFQIKIKEGVLEPNEQYIREQIHEAENEEIEKDLIRQADLLAAEIVAQDDEFVPFYANTVELLRGDTMGVQCVNVELIKWAEILFDPSIIGSEMMGLSEIFENLSATYTIKNVLVCGGFAHLPGLAERCMEELNSFSKTGPVNMVVSKDPKLDPFNGACFSSILPVYTRDEYDKYGAQQLVAMKKYKPKI